MRSGESLVGRSLRSKRTERNDAWKYDNDTGSIETCLRRRYEGDRALLDQQHKEDEHIKERGRGIRAVHWPHTQPRLSYSCHCWWIQTLEKPWSSPAIFSSTCVKLTRCGIVTSSDCNFTPVSTLFSNRVSFSFYLSTSLSLSCGFCIYPSRPLSLSPPLCFSYIALAPHLY